MALPYGIGATNDSHYFSIPQFGLTGSGGKLTVDKF